MTPSDTKLARLEAQAMRSVWQNTEWLTAADIADRAGLRPGNSVATVSRWKRQGRLFALRQDGTNLYPRYALGDNFRPLPVIKDILAMLDGYDPELLAAWFDSTSRFLSGGRPRERVVTEPTQVLAAARYLLEVPEQ